MPLSLTLFSYTPEALAALAQNPEDRSAAVRELVEGMGGRLIAFYHSFGEFHGAIIAETPDDVTGAAIAEAAQSAGHLKTYKTIPLLDVEEGLEALRRAGMAAFRGPEQPTPTAARGVEPTEAVQRQHDTATDLTEAISGLGQEGLEQREPEIPPREGPRGPQGEEPLR
jgi:uncharacterized protein with GYD domain